MDSLWRPRTPLPPRFQDEDSGRLLTDRTTGLVWQRGGAPLTLDWQRAREYVDQLNHTRLGGRGNWRLPSIEELITLLQPHPSGREMCLPPLFEPSPQGLWSCDRRTYTSAWYIRLDLGFVGWLDLSCRNGIKAVSSLRSR